MVRYYDDFTYSSPPSEPTQGLGDTLAEAVGHVTISFADLEEQIATSVSYLLRRGDDIGRAVTTEQSFKNKLNLLVSLYRHTAPESENLDRLRELAGKLQRAEQLRNQVVHSTWLRDIESGAITRRKHSAKMRHGLRDESEPLTLAQIQDIAVYCGYLSWALDDLLFMEFGEDYGTP